MRYPSRTFLVLSVSFTLAQEIPTWQMAFFQSHISSKNKFHPSSPMQQAVSSKMPSIATLVESQTLHVEHLHAKRFTTPFCLPS